MNKYIPAYVILGLLFAMIAATVAEWTANRQYKRAAMLLGLAKIDWKSSAMSEALLLVMKNQGKAFMFNDYQGRVKGIEIHVFTWSRDVAFWSKRRTCAVLKHFDASPLPENLVALLNERAAADVTIQPNWIIIQSQTKVAATDLGRWLETIADAVQGSVVKPS